MIHSVLKELFEELCVFLTQTLIFFMVIVYTTNFLSSEKELVGLINQKINQGTVKEFFLTLLAILTVIGFVTILAKAAESKQSEHYVNICIREIPRTIYLLGSSVVAVMLSIIVFSMFKLSNEQRQAMDIVKFIYLTITYFFVFFICGFYLNSLFKEQINS